MVEHRIVVRFTEEDLPEDPSVLKTDDLKAVSILPLMSDDLFTQVLGILSSKVAGVSIYKDMLIIPEAHPAAKPSPEEMN